MERNTCLGVVLIGTCADCLFASPIRDELQCRRRSPSPLLSGSRVLEPVATWPLVAADDWCGAWVGRDRRAVTIGDVLDRNVEGA